MSILPSCDEKPPLKFASSPLEGLVACPAPVAQSDCAVVALRERVRNALWVVVPSVLPPACFHVAMVVIFCVEGSWFPPLTVQFPVVPPVSVMPLIFLVVASRQVFSA